jgi:hypothetical protein
MLDKIKNYFKPSFRLLIYMKSGNVIVLSHVTDYELSMRGNIVDKLSLTQKNKGTRLLVKTIDTSQIEAVVRCF